MGKKPTNTASWRTLMRRAEGATPAEAKKLRDRAAKMRRVERAAAKKPATTGKVRKVARKSRIKPTKADVAAAQRVANGIAKQVLENTKAEARRFDAAEPIQTSIIDNWKESEAKRRADDAIAAHVRAILVEARKKKFDPEHAIAQRIGNIIGVARYEGQQEADQQHMKAMRNTHRAHTAHVVRGFLSQIVNAQQKYRDGVPGMSLSAYTVVQIAEALQAAGWSPAAAPVDFFET